ncbi:hypothetical protein AUC70_11835 [Methyloceanibacter stevinii]|uniref:Uncharacterized protein n=1 Tax=Methyloceanibacter stevinii TaxID=1774970 RepID=A0A1E3VKQ5_9HYPH|nr:hypothetical protein [Methyloceanibacter stevinii]ODR93546.1 hypothetical protein AUC70_11835 [Methyloceanibacter stevinii]
MGLTVLDALYRAQEEGDEVAGLCLQFYASLRRQDQTLFQRAADLWLGELLAEIERTAESHTTDVLEALKRQPGLEVVPRPGRGLKP